MKVVIGGGPAGMMAAIAAGERGESVTLLERNEKVGRKLAITGKGRCNVTNACPTEDFFDNVPANGSFLYSAVYGFTNHDTVDFFENSGVPLKVERGDRVFPVSDRAYDVVDAMLRRLRQAGVRIVRDRATGITAEKDAVTGVRGEKGFYPCDGAVIATGGMSYAQTGSTGDGYKLARMLGHSVTDIYPSLIPIVTVEPTDRLQGLSLKNAALTVKNANGRVIYTDFGELLFTHFGLSGPMILSASGHMGREPRGCRLIIDLKPALTEEKLNERVLRDFGENVNRDFVNSLGALLPAKMIPYIVERSGIPAHVKINSVTKEQRRGLVRLLKNLDFTAESYRPLNEAIITCGGVNVREVDPSTMESRLVKGLFFAGEVLDVSAYTGGFNLQIAFSTGRLAGNNI